MSEAEFGASELGKRERVMLKDSWCLGLGVTFLEASSTEFQ